jgi:hypothetical protein
LSLVGSSYCHHDAVQEASNRLAWGNALVLNRKSHCLDHPSATERIDSVLRLSICCLSSLYLQVAGFLLRNP